MPHEGIGGGSGEVAVNTWPEPALRPVGVGAVAATWCDLDLDGDDDLYVGNDKGATSPFSNLRYRNNGDGVVDPRDLAILLSNWGASRGDFDASGATDVSDAARLVSAWSE